ncbi:AAA family ATP:ADP antiporter [Sphingobium sp. B1D7B]|uniref:NTP/NDP exchange transporter n=1 Tax=Sphingobium sp. B1D7B TaxID=2940578 RepID=UPI00222400EF|nr:MFS transporter [Sphingobium sp. B1D7B]MCW2404634.1 AAA family ATP:ADP antiporter [Sphingobium sp. B1D7B]
MKAVMAAFLLFFFVLGSYFAVRPARETIGTLLGRDYVADLWLYTAIFSVAIVPLYGWLVSRVRRSVLLPCIYGSVSLMLVALGRVIGNGDIDHGVGAFFYVWISVLNLMLVSVFWSFLLEMFSSEQTGRLFGFIAAGGTLGALIGPLITAFMAERLGVSGLLFLAAGGFACAILCQLILLAIWRPATTATTSSQAPLNKGLGGNPFAGISQVMSSPYLMGIALFVCLLSVANTILYFEQLRIVEQTFPDTDRRTQVFASIDVVVQSLTIATQVFLTGRIASKLGVKGLLTLVPLVMIVGFLALAAFQVFAVLAIVFVVRRWGEYAFVRPGREMLFSKLDTETKYKAKSFVDVPIYRFADYVGAQAKTGIDAMTASPTVSVLTGAVLAGVWAFNGLWLGRQHDAAPSHERRANA